ncbi:MAG: hypothetical protein WD512_16730 [Candidatus Paceibacterota bacterium]
MPEINNNPENNNIIEQNQSSIESQFEAINSIESTKPEFSIEQVQPMPEQVTSYEAERHINQVV